MADVCVQYLIQLTCRTLKAWEKMKKKKNNKNSARNFHIEKGRKSALNSDYICAKAFTFPFSFPRDTFHVQMYLLTFLSLYLPLTLVSLHFIMIKWSYQTSCYGVVNHTLFFLILNRISRFSLVNDESTNWL